MIEKQQRSPTEMLWGPLSTLEPNFSAARALHYSEGTGLAHSMPLEASVRWVGLGG